ncbi:hypothetical protein [Mycolicibacterium helvum]|uniref:Phytanoyl-CoA dioxygenase n=1 Tax=Mycolicibacterium helvum TaxID=1534349 RepID=A0A7I7T249_9MYCO|nr:hypothetical protein [Mycolicibacterium helvum]BBY63354.1 hypothetical protein MHEL_15970 [Mycolicibacterium helvum]
MGSDAGCRDDKDLFTVSQAQISQIEQDLHVRGMSILRGAISPDWIEAARKEVEAYVERHGSGDHDLFDLDEWECPAIRQLAENPEMESMLRTLAVQSSSGVESTESYDRRALRIHDGTRGVIPYLWHYDANTVTAMIPVTVPDAGTGQFGTLPPDRPIRRSVTSMVRERMRIGKDPYPKATEQFKKAPERSTYPLIPGEALIFYGYRTMHTALPWPVGQWRANIVLHYGLPTRLESGPLRAAFGIRDAITRKR